MGKRIKHVFSSTSQVCHVWAQQTQDSGRNSQGNVYFNGADIYSYGSHYHAARIHTIRGKRVALLQSSSYSNTTSQHMGDIRRALLGLMPVFSSPDVTSFPAALKHAEESVSNAIASAMRRMKVANRNEMAWPLEYILETYAELNSLRAVMGKKPVKANTKAMAAVSAHLEKRLARYRELNSPEAIAKREAESGKRAEAKQRAAERKLARDIDEWRANGGRGVYGLPYELLRVTADRVQTSRGAEVPLSDAVKLYRAVSAGIDVNGQRVGHFRVEAITDTGSDKVVQIGCHKILLSEAAKLFSLKVA